MHISTFLVHINPALNYNTIEKEFEKSLIRKKNGFEVIFLQEYFEGINVIITTSP
jgi:hypothetical protein